jgi:hypothetical protein
MNQTEEEIIANERKGLPQYVRIRSCEKKFPFFGMNVEVELDDGTKLPCTSDVRIDIPIDGVCRATIEFPLPYVDVVALGDIFVTTLGGKKYRLYPVEPPQQ